MSTPVTSGRLAPAVDRRTLLYGALAVNAEVAATVAYLLLSPAEVTNALFLVYPFVWINAGLWGVARVSPAPPSGRHRAVAAALGVAYFLLLGGVGGLFHPGGVGIGASIHWLPPGWGPALVYAGSAVTVVLMPFKVAGYAALAYLVYAAVADASSSMLSGLVGLVSCVSCTWPVAAALLAGVLGSASPLAVAANAWPYALSTVVFVLSVALLAWRPGFGR